MRSLTGPKQCPREAASPAAEEAAAVVVASPAAEAAAVVVVASPAAEEAAVDGRRRRVTRVVVDGPTHLRIVADACILVEYRLVRLLIKLYPTRFKLFLLSHAPQKTTSA